MADTVVWGHDLTGPVWGAQAYPQRGGQDHLGLGSVSSDRLLPRLAPGINVLTYHPRYWSFYSWVLSAYWERELPRSRTAFRSFYRPREAVFAAACLSCDMPEHATLLGTIVGSGRIRGQLAKGDFDPQFDYIKAPLGGYGLYYRSTMQAMGVMVGSGRDSPFPWDAPTPEGRAIAAAYDRAISGTRIHGRLTADDVQTVATSENLVEFARHGCLCQLSSAPDHDLPLVQDLFLHGGVEAEATVRRQSLRFLLDLSESQHAGRMSEELFRELIYNRTTVFEDSYEPRDDLRRVARRWRVYQGREYFSFAFNRIFGWLVRAGLTESQEGLTLVPLTRIWELVDEELAGSSLEEGLLAPPGAFSGRAPVSRLRMALRDQVPGNHDPDGAWPRAESSEDGEPILGVDENWLHSWCRGQSTGRGALVSMLALLMLLYERFGTPEQQAAFMDDQDFLVEGGALRVGMTTFFIAFHRKLAADVPVEEMLRWIITDYVMIQHERIATRKLPDDTFRFHRVGDQVQFFDKDAGADFNDSRYAALSSTAHELGLVSSLQRSARQLTPDGRRLLDTGDLAASALVDAAQAFAAPRDEHR